MELTKNQVEWAKRKHGYNAQRRVVYAAKTATARAERQQRRDARLADEELRRISKAYRKPSPTRDRVRELIQQTKAGRPGLDCTEHFHPDVMEFDHRIPSQKVISVAKCRNVEECIAEIAKCDLVCANCHRVRTARRRLGLLAVLPEPEYFI